jgi:glycerophosphoryl diester phosphodiesterase
MGNFAIAWAGTPDFPGSIVAKTYGLNAEMLPSTLDNTKIYDIMYATLFGEPQPPEVVFGTPGSDRFDSVIPDAQQFVGDAQQLFTSSGNDYVDVFSALGDNRIDLGSGDDIIFAGSNNRLIGGSGSDRFFLGYPEGNNLITGGSGADQFWLVTDAVDLPTKPNIITDFTLGVDVLGFAGTSLTFADVDILQSGRDTIIRALDQDLAKLLNLPATSLNSSNFVFA